MRLVLAAGAAAVAVAVLAAGIYFLASPAASPAGSLSQNASVPRPTQAAPTPAPGLEQRSTIREFLPARQVPALREDDVSLDPSTGSQAEPDPPLNAPADGRTTDFAQAAASGADSTSVAAAASIAVDAAVAPPTAEPTPPAPEPTPDAPPVEVERLSMSTGGKMRAPDLVPQTAGNGSDDQVQFTPEKTELKYPNLGSHLNQLVTIVEAGLITPEKAAEGTSIHQEESVAVTIRLSGNVYDVVQFLENNGGDPRNVGEDYIEAYVPVTLLGPLSEQPGVLRVREIIPPEGS